MRIVRSMTLLLCLLLAVSSVTGAEAAADAEWPCFHGPNRDNRSTETGLLKQWPENGPDRLWAAGGIGIGYSSVSIAGGRIYTAGSIDNTTFVTALDLEGRRVWQKPNGRSWKAGPRQRHAVGYAGARSTPTYDDGRLYHLGERGRLAVFDAASGEETWSIDLQERFHAETPEYGYTESVLILGDRLFCCPGGTKGHIVCLRKADGETVWATPGIEGTVAFSSLVPAEVAGVRQILGMSSSHAFGVDPETGALLWSVPHANFRDNNVTDPIPYKDCVFASSGYGKGSLVVRLRPQGGGLKAETVWSSDLLDNHHGGVVRVGDYVYGAGHEAKGWFCLDVMTGKPAWRAPGKGALTFADGHLYCLDERGTMTLVKATPETYEQVSSFRVPQAGAGLYWAHPVVCGGRLHVRHADRLFAYAVAAR
jgi:outer membrane protein assembly factor BamB